MQCCLAFKTAIKVAVRHHEPRCKGRRPGWLARGQLLHLPLYSIEDEACILLLYKKKSNAAEHHVFAKKTLCSLLRMFEFD